jgi:GH25 family lysozyme M1 (1,4-beta-N-acetylmuramidase)
MTDPVQELAQAEKDRADARKVLEHAQASVADLSDAHRKIHNVIDRLLKQKDAPGVERLLTTLRNDSQQFDKQIKEHRDLSQNKRDLVRKLTDRIKRLRKQVAKSGISGDGPDVSVYQGSVDWRAVGAGHKFAFTKATEGLTYNDPTFSKDRLDAMLSNLQGGAYHFGHPSNSSDGEAEHFVSHVKAAGGHFISFSAWQSGSDGVLGVLDFESQPYSASWAGAWADKFKALTGVKPIIYGGGYSLNPILGALGHFDAVWISAYASDWKPYFNGPDQAVKFWQFTDHGSVSGISSSCDLNHFIG